MKDYERIIDKRFSVNEGTEKLFRFDHGHWDRNGSVSKNTSYTIGFVSFIFSLFSVSTISYDELDNGNAFLFSLPIARKTYAVEKYCFGLIMGLGAWLAVSALGNGCGVVRGQGPVSELVITAFIVLPLVLFMMAVMIPVMLKFGAEKGRIAVIFALLWSI